MKSNLCIDPERCTRCGLCVKDCTVHALTCDDTGVHFAANGENICINCQHCLAICPHGALSINGISPADCAPLSTPPAPETMLNLIRQRRSIRHFLPQALPPEVMDKLIDSLNWTPTGCNARGLQFFVAGPDGVAACREVTNKWLKRLIKSGIMGIFLPRYKRFFSAIMDGDDVIYRNAPHLIVVTVSKKSPCKHADPFIALTQFDLMAQTLGVGTCWCGFAEYAFKLIPALRRIAGVPKGHKIGAAMLFGTPAVNYQRSTAPAPLPAGLPQK